MSSRATFQLLWKMWNELDNHDDWGRPGNTYGTIISRYAGMIDDRIENSGHSRATDHLMLFETYQLEEELKRRKEAGDEQ